MTQPYFGRFTPEMEAVVRPHVQGASVWDLGAGDLWHSRMLLRVGARDVVAVDKQDWDVCTPPGVRKVRSYFADVQPPTEGIDVAYLAWPVNHAHIPGLEALLDRSRVVIYLGCNLGGTSCGGRDLFEYLTSRQVLEHVPHERNSLVVYGNPLRGARELLPEEWAALHPERVWTLDEAAEAAYSSSPG